MFAAQKCQRLNESHSTKNIPMQGLKEKSKLTNILYRTVIDSFKIFEPNIKLAEEITNFVSKSTQLNENKAQFFIGKMSLLANDIKLKELRKYDNLLKKKKNCNYKK